MLLRTASTRTVVCLLAALFLVSSAMAADEEHTSALFVNRVITATDGGAEPATVELAPRGSLVFFRNGTKDSLLRVEVDYGSKRAYCSTGRMAMGEDGVVRSRVPLQPGGFATVCFPDAGTYPVKFLGTGGGKRVVTAQIIVR